MKKLTTTLTVLAALCLTLASCSKDDTKIAMKLSGEWEGYWGMYYSDPAHPEQGEWDSYMSTVVFGPDPHVEYATFGRGYQIDWYDDKPNEQGYVSPYERMTYCFDWEVHDGKIYLKYPNEPNFNVTIRDYDLTKKHFTGYFNNSKKRFDLRAVDKYYSWWDYARLNTERAIYWTWVGVEVIGVLTYDNYYYANTRADGTPVNASDSTATEGRMPVRIGNRFAEGNANQ